MKEYYVIVSGENIKLAKAELKALLLLVCRNHKVSWYDRLAIIKINSSPVDFLLDRAALIKEAGYVVRDVHSSSDIIADFSGDDIESVVNPDESFCIRTCSYTGQKDSQYREDIVMELGTKICNQTGAKVSMDNPDVDILVVLTPEKTFVCKSIKSKLRGLLREREPGRKEFFHPSMMNAQLARIMCNLARVMPGDIVVDPFCGGGGILCEIASLGAIAVGLDLSWHLLTGANRNMAGMNNSKYSLVQGDAQFIPISGCNHIVTDPPYGRVSSTKGSDPTQLVEALFRQSLSLLRSSGNVCICASTEMQVLKILNDLGLKAEFAIQVRVHRSLTREVIAFNL